MRQAVSLAHTFYSLPHSIDSTLFSCHTTLNMSDTLVYTPPEVENIKLNATAKLYMGEIAVTTKIDAINELLNRVELSHQRGDFISVVFDRLRETIETKRTEIQAKNTRIFLDTVTQITHIPDLDTLLQKASQAEAEGLINEKNHLEITTHTEAKRISVQNSNEELITEAILEHSTVKDILTGVKVAEDAQKIGFLRDDNLNTVTSKAIEKIKLLQYKKTQQYFQKISDLSSVQELTTLRSQAQVDSLESEITQQDFERITAEIDKKITTAPS